MQQGNKTEGKAKSKMGRRCEEWFEEDGGDQLETKKAGEETMERSNWASQNSQRVVELKEEKEEWCYFPSTNELSSNTHILAQVLLLHLLEETYSLVSEIPKYGLNDPFKSKAGAGLFSLPP